MLSKTKEYRAKYWQKWASKNKPPIQKACLICGNQFVQNPKIDGKAKTCRNCRKGKCQKCGAEFKRDRLSKKYCSKACHISVQKGKIPTGFIGNWGVKPRTYHLRKRDKHGGAFDIDWRKAIFARDKFTCRNCGQIGGKLQAHHIKPYSKFPELRHVLSNGLTLCLECHKKTDTFGWQNYWKSQIRK